VKALVTGAGGMLGRALIPALTAAGHEAVGLKRGDADVTRLDALRHPLKALRPDWIFHLAAFTRVDECESRVDHAHLVNGLGARNVAQAAADAGAAVIALSTDYVFPGDATRPYREYDAVGPRSVYGASKLAGEEAVREVNPRHIIVRSAWLYGRGGTNFVDSVLARARKGEPLAVVDDQRGSPTWTEDLGSVLVELMERGVTGTYHATNAGDCTWHEFAGEICGQVGARVEVARRSSADLARPAKRPAYSVLDTGQLRQALGHELPHWRDALARYVAQPVGATGDGR
jgi:dTDP-4-dehydrorhamnose reductase